MFRLGLMGVQASYAHLVLVPSTRGVTLADLGLRSDVGAVQKTCRQIGRAPPTPRGQHARGVSAVGSPWIEPPYRRCWLGPSPGELQILRQFSTDSPRAWRRRRRGPPPRCRRPASATSAQRRRVDGAECRLAPPLGPRPEPETCDILRRRRRTLLPTVRRPARRGGVPRDSEGLGRVKSCRQVRRACPAASPEEEASQRRL